MVSYNILASYGSLSLTDSSPAQSFTEPLSLTEVKTFLAIDTSDTSHDTELSGFITGAREQAEILQGRDLVRKQWDLSMDYFPGHCPIELRPNLASVDLVKYRDSDGAYTTLAENTDYVVDAAKQPGIAVPAYGQMWPSFSPWPSSAVLVRFTSGVPSNSTFWSDAGARVKIGMKLLINHWNENRIPFEAIRGVMAEYPFAVVSNLSYGAVPRVR